MSYTKCVYHNCDSRSSEIAMFRFPTKHEDLLKAWLRNSGNDSLNTLSVQELRRRYICARHFRSSSINRGRMRSRLIGPAVPLHFESDEVKEEPSNTMSIDEELANVDVNNEIISVKMCRICLRSNNLLEYNNIDKRLLHLYKEITGVNVFAHPNHSFCPLCEYKLRKFYNFKQRCIRSKYLLRKAITNPGHIFDSNLIPQDLGFSMQSDRRGFFNYKYHHTIVDKNKTTETNEPQNDAFKNDSEREVMIETDSIKIEVDSLEDPIGVGDDAKEYDAKINDASVKDEYIEIDVSKLVNDASVEDEHIENDASVEDEDTVNNASIEVEDIENDASVEDEDIENDASELHNLDDIDDLHNSDDEYVEAYLRELEMLSTPKDETIKKESSKTDLSCTTPVIKQKKAKTVEKEKFTLAQLEALRNESFDLNDFTTDELECIKKCLSPQQKKELSFRKQVEKFKQNCLNALDQGKVDLGEVTMTKELFLEMFAKSNTSYIKKLGYKNCAAVDILKVKKFMLYLLNRFNPKYETVFKIDYLNTQELKLKEFESRKNSKQYIEAAYKCEKCYQPFVHQLKLKYHIKMWHNPTPNDIVCNICTMRFASHSTYRSHRKNNHAEVYTCRLCPLVTYHFSVMINHYNQHKGVVYQCETCLSVYANKTTLDSHRGKVHATSYICTACARTFLSENGLSFHKKYKHKDSAVADPADATLCTECNITFDSHAVYLRHARTAHKERYGTEYKCYYCKEGFDSIEALRQHKVELNHQRAPQEEIHGRSVGTKPSGANRTKRVSDLKKPYRKCPVCQVNVPNSFGSSMYRHYRKAHPDVPYDPLHKGSKELLCEQCGMTFGVYSYYLDHKNLHTGAKPYACKQCPAHFATRRHLMIHSERHRPPRYQCKQCGKLFLSAANLFNHRRTHGERRLECEICFKSFLHTMALNEHIKGVHNRIRRVRKVPQRDNNKHYDLL